MIQKGNILFKESLKTIYLSKYMNKIIVHIIENTHALFKIWLIGEF